MHRNSVPVIPLVAIGVMVIIGFVRASYDVTAHAEVAAKAEQADMQAAQAKQIEALVKRCAELELRLTTIETLRTRESKDVATAIERANRLHTVTLARLDQIMSSRDFFKKMLDDVIAEKQEKK